jgi:hypothetical protein
MTICYADESGTDSNLPIAVVGGLLFDYEGAFWLDVDWQKVLNKHGVTGPIHMREFTPDGRFRHVSKGARRALFGELVKVINDNKLFTAASTLSAEQYREQFKGLSKLSMYGACFANLITLMTSAMKIHGQHRWPLSFVLDDGNHYKGHIIEGLQYFLKVFPRVTGVVFDSDHAHAALQAADVLTWAARRRLSQGAIPAGLEPISDLFLQYHLDFNYEERWMKDIADKIRQAEHC